MEKPCCAEKPKATPFSESLKLYRPLVVIVAVSLFSALAINDGMKGLMAIFLLQLAVLKLFDIRAFADSFARYDVVAKRSRAYAMSYPFIELLLSGLYFSGLLPVQTYILTIVVMLVGCIGVIKVIRSGTIVQCACVGTGFNLPVGRVTLVENLAMAGMAAVMLFYVYAA